MPRCRARPPGKGLDLRDAEVAHLGAAVGGEEDVRRLDIAVHNAVRVRGVQAPSGVRSEAQRISERQRAGGNTIGEGAAGDELLDQIAGALGIVAGDEVVDGDEIGVTAGAGSGIGLAGESLVNGAEEVGVADQ